MNKDELLEYFDCAWSNDKYKGVCNLEDYCIGRDKCKEAKEHVRSIIERSEKIDALVEAGDVLLEEARLGATIVWTEHPEYSHHTKEMWDAIQNYVKAIEAYRKEEKE